MRSGGGRGLRRTRLNPVSEKRKDEQAERDRVRRAVFKRDHYECRAGPLIGTKCAGPLDAHEPLMRSRGGDYLDSDECISVCRKHHDWIHAEPEKATKLGLLEHSWQRREDDD